MFYTTQAKGCNDYITMFMHNAYKKDMARSLAAVHYRKGTAHFAMSLYFAPRVSYH